MGLLADEPMRRGKKMCHALFDPLWQGKEPARRTRVEAYRWLAGEMGIALEDCYFGHFNIHQIRQAFGYYSRRCGKPLR